MKGRRGEEGNGGRVEEDGAVEKNNEG